MKLKVLELLTFAVFILKCTTSAQQRGSEVCEKVVDLSNVLKSLKTVQCDGQISVDSMKSTTALLRSLYCKCERDIYVPKPNSCLQTHNTELVTPMIQKVVPKIIEGIRFVMSPMAVTQSQICDAIQIFIDNMLNVGNVCVSCALMYNDRNNGESAAKMTDLCYETALKEMTQDYKNYQIKVPQSAPAILAVIQNNMKEINAKYNGRTIRQCFGKFGGQNLDFCH